MFWFFQFQFRRAYDSTYDSNFSYPLGHKLPYDSDVDLVSGEDQALVVQRMDNAIHGINPYPADSLVSFVNTYPLDSDLSCG